MPLPLPTFIPLLGPFGISGFAVAGVVGILLASVVNGRILRRSPDVVRQGAAGAFEAIIVGMAVYGRLANQFWTQDMVWSAPLTWLLVTGNSLSYAGGLVGAISGLMWSLRRHPRRGAVAVAVADALAPGAALGVAVGWLGVPVLGRLTTVPWRLPVAVGVGVHPVQIYGLLAFGAVAAWLAWQIRHLDYPGQNLVSFVALMSAFRFVLGFFEQTPPAWGPWSLAQIADIGLAVAALAASGWLRTPAAAGLRLTETTEEAGSE